MGSCSDLQRTTYALLLSIPTCPIVAAQRLVFAHVLPMEQTTLQDRKPTEAQGNRFGISVSSRKERFLSSPHDLQIALLYRFFDRICERMWRGGVTLYYITYYYDSYLSGVLTLAALTLSWSMRK